MNTAPSPTTTVWLEGCSVIVGGNGVGGTGGGGTGGGPQGGAGGKGVVILSMPSANFSGKTTGSPVESTSGGNKILQFNDIRYFW